MVILEAAVSSTLQEEPRCVNLIPSTSDVESCVPTVRLAVNITAVLQQKKSCHIYDVIQEESQNRPISALKVIEIYKELNELN